MLRRLVPMLGTSAFALAAFLVAAEPAAAQRFGGRSRGFSLGYSPAYGFSAGYNTGRYSPYYGGNYAPRYFNNGHSPYYRQSYGRSYAPAYEYDSSYDYSAAARSYWGERQVSSHPPEDKTVASFSIRVPASSEVWFGDVKMTQTGSVRQFVSPPIASDGEYTYQIRARWMEGEQAVDQTRTVSFHAGDRLTVSFSTLPSPTPAAKRAEDTKNDNPLESTRIEALDQKGAELASKSHDGKVVSIAGNQLVMTNTEGKEEHTCTLAADVKVTCDGRICEASDLKPGMRIRVTTNSDDSKSATRIEALDVNREFEVTRIEALDQKGAELASKSHDGKVVSIAGNQLVMTNTEGKEEHTCTLAADVKVTCDGRICKASDLKPGMRIRVTTESGDSHAATRIEALDLNRDFERAG